MLNPPDHGVDMQHLGDAEVEFVQQESVGTMDSF